MQYVNVQESFGAQITHELKPAPRTHAVGHVTSSYWSSVLGRSIALAVVENGRALEGVTVHIPMPNGSIAAKELAGAKNDGHTLMVFNGSLAYITPLAVAGNEAVDIKGCLRSVDWSDDVHVLDSQSTDATRELDGTECVALRLRVPP